MSGVDVSGDVFPNDGQALVWNELSGVWMPGNVVSSGGGGGGGGIWNLSESKLKLPNSIDKMQVHDADFTFSGDGRIIIDKRTGVANDSSYSDVLIPASSSSWLVSENTLRQPTDISFVNINDARLKLTGRTSRLVIDLSDSSPFEAGQSQDFGWDVSGANIIYNGEGNVGIGTDAPSARLDVDGDIIATNTRLHYPSHPDYAGFAHKNHTGTGNYCLIHDANGTTFLNSSSGRHIRFRNNNVDSMILTDTGRLGIGTTNPSQKLHVVGNICATGNITESDRRIKTNITPINDGTALNKINQLESYEYNYIDPERKKSQKTIGFIAQEVKEVIPNAVTILEDIIPDEMRVLIDPQWDNLVLTIPDLDMSPENLTGKCKFYVSNDPSGNDEICKEIECVRDASGNKTNQFRFEQEYVNVFFYGKEVNDFHALDKNQIFALHHSAIQELSRKNDIKTTQIAELQAENAELKNEISLIKQHLGI